MVIGFKSMAYVMRYSEFPVEVLSVDDLGRRRDWSDAEKVRIVEESLQGFRQGSATARRYGLSRSLLTAWRRQYRSGLLSGSAPTTFVRLSISPPAATSSEVVSPPRSEDDKTIEIGLRNGRRLTILASLDPTILARRGWVMIAFPAKVKVWIAGGVADMRRGMNSLALNVQQGLGRDPRGGEVFRFRERKGDLVKVLWHDGVGMSLYIKRLEAGKFIWPVSQNGSAVPVSAAQLGYLLEGIDSAIDAGRNDLRRRADRYHSSVLLGFLHATW